MRLAPSLSLGPLTTLFVATLPMLLLLLLLLCDLELLPEPVMLFARMRLSVSGLLP